MDLNTLELRRAGQRGQGRQINTHHAVGRADPQHLPVLHETLGRIDRGEALEFGYKAIVRPPPQALVGRKPDGPRGVLKNVVRNDAPQLLKIDQGMLRGLRVDRQHQDHA